MLWAPVAARQDEFRAGACGTNASGAENAPRYAVQDVGDSPKLPEAAPRRSPESWGGRGTFRGTARGSVATPPVPAQCVRRPGRGGRRNGYFKRLPWSKVPLLKTGAQSEHFVTIKGVRAGSSRENLRFSSWMSDQYIHLCL